MGSPNPPTLLDALRQRSDTLRAQHRDADHATEQARQDLDRRLRKVFRWLEEALRHLDVIRPVVAHTFHLDRVLAIAQPRFERGFVSCRQHGLAGMETLDHVEVFYRLEATRPVIVRVSPSSAAAIEERLRGSTLAYRYETERDDRRVVRHGVFHVQPTVAASIRFQPDHDRQIVSVTLCNVDRFETVVLDFAPHALDEAALEDLVKFILGESTAFLRRAPLAGIDSLRRQLPAARRA